MAESPSVRNLGPEAWASSHSQQWLHYCNEVQSPLLKLVPFYGCIIATFTPFSLISQPASFKNLVYQINYLQHKSFHGTDVAL